MQLLIDGDIIVFRAGFACEKTAYFITHDGEAKRFQYKKDLMAYCEEHGIEEPKYETDVELEPVGNALHTVRIMLQSIKDTMQANDMRVFLSGPNNYRYSVATLKPYKGNRDTAHRPTHEKAIKDFLVREYGAVYSDGEECDDLLGITQYAAWLRGEESCIASLDKDLHMIPGMHFNFVKEVSKVVDLEDANRHFWKQMVTGDPTDNIPGIQGCGPKAADRIVDPALPVEVCAQRVADAYKESYKDTWREAMLENGRLLWIRREPNQWWNIPEYIT